MASNIVTFLAQRIILGFLDFERVPDILKPEVKKVIEEYGLGFMIE